MLLAGARPTSTIRAPARPDRGHGTDRWIGGRTIDTHVKNLRAKIESDPQQPTSLVTVYGVGCTLHAG